MWNGQSIQSLPLWSGNPKTNATIPNNLIVSSLQTNFISTAIINVSSIFTNFVSSATANIPNLNVSTINGSKLSNYSASNWSYYPALSQVEMAYNNIHNAGNVNMKGNFTMAGTGNNFSPYWYNAQIDANINTGASGNSFNPTNNQFFSDYSVKNINVNLNIPGLSYETASHKMYPASILPVGRNVLNAKNFNLSLPYSGFLAGNYRGYGELSVDGGDGTTCYLKLNPDIITTSVPNTASLSYFNGDSYLASITELGVSRVGVTFGRVINLATYEARLSAGYVGTLNSYLPVCEILSYAPAGGAGGGTTTNIVNGGAFGARNDLIAYNNFTDGGLVGVAMEIGSRGKLDIYSGGDLHIGDPKTTYFNNTQGAVYIYKCEEIYANNIFGGLIDGIKVRNSMNMCNRNITNLANLNGLPVNNYNNELWSYNKALIDVDINNYGLINVSSINGISTSKYIASNWSLYPAVSYVNMCNNNISNVNNIVLDSIYSIDSGFINMYDSLRLQNNDIEEVDNIKLNSIEQNTGADIQVFNTFDMMSNNISNVSTLFVSAIRKGDAGIIDIFNDISLQNRDIKDVITTNTANINVDNVGTLGASYVTYNASMVFKPIVDNSYGIGFKDLSDNIVSFIALASDNVLPPLLITNQEAISIESANNDILLQAYGQVVVGSATSNATLGGYVDVNINAVTGNVVVSGNTYTTVNGGSSYIDLSGNIDIATPGDVKISAVNLDMMSNNIVNTLGTYTEALYTNNIYGNTATEIVVRETFNMSNNDLTNVLGTYTEALYANNLYGNTGSNIIVQDDLNMNSNSIFRTNIIGATTISSINTISRSISSVTISTNSLFISTINNKQYPFVSTLNKAVITSNATFSGTAHSVLLQSNTITVPFPGKYNIYQNYAVSKGSGGGIHASLVYSSNGTVANISNAVNWTTMGFSRCPFMDSAGVSTFTTAVTNISFNSGSLSRNLYAYDSGTGSYTASFYIAPPVIQYIPSVGINPEI